MACFTRSCSSYNKPRSPAATGGELMRRGLLCSEAASDRAMPAERMAVERCQVDLE